MNCSHSLVTGSTASSNTGKLDAQDTPVAMATLLSRLFGQE